jgi:hypothetical protein
MVETDNAQVLPMTDTSAKELALVEVPENKATAPAGDGKTKETTAQAPAAPVTPDKQEWEWPAEFVAEHPELAGKFKSLEALAASYKNLEGEFTKSRQEGKVKPEAKPEVTPQTPETAAKDAKEFFERFVENPEKALDELYLPKIRSIVGTTLDLSNAWAALVAEDPSLATDDKLNEGLTQMVPAIGQMVVTKVPIKDALKRAIAVIRGEQPKSEKTEKELREQARQEVRQDILGTHGESGKTGGAAITTGQPAEEDVVGDMLAIRGPSVKLTLR